MVALQASFYLAIKLSLSELSLVCTTISLHLRYRQIECRAFHTHLCAAYALTEHPKFAEAYYVLRQVQYNTAVVRGFSTMISCANCT